MKVNTIEKAYKYSSYGDLIEKRQFKQKKQNVKKSPVTFAEVLKNVKKSKCI
ncbi:MAG: hypothetical protein K0R54_826 [Clostridiaceae bacterium]|jgi:hypothetical protein|nr:hypothetical protein [Clostridiaceae bacterium]